MTLRRRGRLRPVSEKRAALRDDLDDARAQVLRRWPCEAPAMIGRALRQLDLDDADRDRLALVVARCRRDPTEAHHLTKRSRDPSAANLADPAGLAALCQRCHVFTETDPRLAQLVGLLRSAGRAAKTVLYTDLDEADR